MKTLIRHLLPASLFLAALVSAQAQYTLSPLWAGNVGNPTYWYLTNNNTHRGLAFNRETGHLIVVSRYPTNGVHILDPDTGAFLGSLKYNSALITGGALVINLVGVADDGAIYVGNVTAPGSVATPSIFRLYRWAGEADTDEPVLAFNGDASDGSLDNLQRRFGDTLTVRGSGIGTQVLVASRSGSLVSLLRTTDGINFTATPLISGIPLGTGSLGLYWGGGDTFYAKAPSTPLRLLQMDVPAGTAPAIASPNSQSMFTPPYSGAIPATTTGLGYDPVSKLLALVNYSTHNVSLYDLSDPNNPILQETKSFPPPAAANPNGTAAAAFGAGKMFALDSNNGILAFEVVPPAAPVAPIISGQPQNVEALEGYFITLTGFAAGTTPMSYQWNFRGSPIPGATNSILSLSNLTTSQSGAYGIVVNNAAGTASATSAVLVVQPVVCSDAMNLLWKQAPGSRPWLTTDNTQRGLAYNVLSNHVLVVSRAGSNNVPVLNGDDGVLDHYLNLGGVVGGTFAITLIGVADDGAVYACNLTLNGVTNAFKIYRWADDAATTVPTLAYSGDPGAGVSNRWGDSFDVRGQGTQTEILIGSRDGTNVVIFTTSDLVNFSPSQITVSDVPPGALGIGLAFGADTTIWAKPSGVNLRQIEYDLDAQTAIVVREFTGAQFSLGVCAIGVDPAHNWLAGVTLENPDNLRLYDLQAGAQRPLLLDQEFFPTDNANANGTGAADFGAGRLYTLDTNNGLLAMTVQPPSPRVLVWGIENKKLVLEWGECAHLQAADDVTGPFVDVPGATSPWEVDPHDSPRKFYRLR